MELLDSIQAMTLIALAPASFLLLLLQAGYLIFLRNGENPYHPNVNRHAELCATKTGYVAAFMARAGIIISMSLFLLSITLGLSFEGYWVWLQYSLVMFCCMFLLWGVGTVFLVSNLVLKWHHEGRF